MKRKYLLIVLVFVLSFCISPKFILAKEKVYCPLCVHRNSDDPLYKKERQFYQKVSIIKGIYGDSIDTTALTFAVLNRYTGRDVAYEREYDTNFNENDYRTRNNTLKQAISKTDISNLKDNEKSLIEQNEKYDLLTLAAIVMVDSNKNGQYSDVCFMDGLAGYRLVGNDQKVDVNLNPFTDFGAYLNQFLGNVVNELTCHNLIANGTDSYIGDSTKVRNETEKLRVKNIENVCQNGYIGGLYSEVKNISNEDAKTNRKKIIAQNIINQANYYRKLYGSEEEGGTACPAGSLSGNTQASVFMDMSTDDFINALGPIAQADYSQTGVFASITLAQGILESGWGKSGLSQDANALFGIKCSGWPTCVNMATQEFGDGGYYTINDGFRAYDSVEASISDHSQFLHENSNYEDAGVFSATSYEEQARAIKRAGYATAPNYAESLINMIEEYNLDKWDVKTNVSSNGSCLGTGSVGGWNIRKVVPTSSDGSFTEFEASNGSSNRGQCVWYAKGRSFEIVNELKDKSTINDSQADAVKKLVLSISGNGGDIYQNAKDKFNTSDDIKKPKAGSFIVWKKRGDYGHVAVIEEVTDTNITVIGGYTSTGSCPNNWDCVNIEEKTMSLDEFYNGYGKNYNGGYEFDGYVYFLEPIGTDMPSIGNSSTKAAVKAEPGAKFGSRKDFECVNGKAVKKGASCVGSADSNSSEYNNRLGQLYNYYQASGKPKDIPVGSDVFAGVGCGTASLMAAYYMYTGDDFDVNKFVGDAIDQGYLSDSGSNSRLFYTPDGAQLMTDNWGIYGERLDRDINSIVNALSQGKKVLFNVGINSSTNWPTRAGHYILFDHYNQASNEIYIFDPVGDDDRNGYFSVDTIDSQLVNHMNNDPVAISINGLTSTGGCNTPNPNANKVVDCVKNQVGKPYVYGDAGPDSFDCSGLVMYCYKQAYGVDLPHQSGSQVEDGRFNNVNSYNELTPGDIIVTYGHAAVYIGDGKIIHAARPDLGVIESPVDIMCGDGDCYYRHYKG